VKPADGSLLRCGLFSPGSVAAMRHLLAAVPALSTSAPRFAPCSGAAPSWRPLCSPLWPLFTPFVSLAAQTPPLSRRLRALSLWRR